MSRVRNSFAVFELDRDAGAFPGYYTVVMIRATAGEIRNVKQVRGSTSDIMKSDYRVLKVGSHSVTLLSDGSKQSGTIYTLKPF